MNGIVLYDDGSAEGMAGHSETFQARCFYHGMNVFYIGLQIVVPFWPVGFSIAPQIQSDNL
jgi:hypothetical protein